MRQDLLTGKRIDTANPGPYVNGLPKCTSEFTEITNCCAVTLYKICAERGGKAATWVNLRATSSDVCEQLFAKLQNKSKVDFFRALSKNSFVLNKLLDPNTEFYMPGNSITKHAKHAHGCFNDESTRHHVRVERSNEDITTTKGSESLRVTANSKAMKA